MSKILKITLYMFILYPLVGYLSITFFGLKPYFISTSMVIVSFLYMLQKNSSIIFPAYLRFYVLYAVTVFVSTHLINGYPIDNNAFATILLDMSLVLVFLTIENSKISISFIHRSSRLIIYLIIFATVVSIIQYFQPLFFTNSEIYTGAVNSRDNVGYARRILSIFTWGDFMNTGYMSIGFVIFYGIIITKRRSEKKWIRVILLSFIVVFLSQYRTAYLTFLIMTIAAYFRKFKIKYFFQILIIILFIVLFLDYLHFDVDYLVAERLASESALTRIDAFNAVIYAFPENPIWGTGGVRTETLFKGFGRVTNIHNGFLAIAFYYGMFAFIFYALFIVYLFKKTIRTAKLANYWLPLVGMICYVAATMTMPSEEFYLPGLILMMVYNKYYYDKFLNNKKGLVYD